jgi:signal peptidase II
VRRRRLLPAAALAALVVFILDQTSKLWAIKALPPAERQLVAVPGWLWFRLLKNTGGTFSLLRNHNLLFIGASLLVLVAIAVLLGRDSLSHPVSAIALGVIAGGAAGNLVDRLRLAGVVDFIYVRWWPAYFNLADVAIRLGVLVFVARLLFEQAARHRRTR